MTAAERVAIRPEILRCVHSGKFCYACDGKLREVSALGGMLYFECNSCGLAQGRSL